jgi:hypothetical protein
MGFHEEKMAIIGVLEYASNAMENLINWLKPEHLQRFQDAWLQETKPQVEEAIETLRGNPRLEDIQSRAYERYLARGRERGREAEDWFKAELELREELVSDEGPLRRLLRRAGLAGRSLRLKLSYLADAVRNGLRGKFLGLLNKFLGSLAAAVHGAEALKELKEWLEGLLEQKAEPDTGLSGLYAQAGWDPFWVERLEKSPA